MEAGIAIHIIRYDYDFEKDQVPALEELRLNCAFQEISAAWKSSPQVSHQQAELEAISDDLYHLKLKNIPLYSIILLKDNPV